MKLQKISGTSTVVVSKGQISSDLGGESVILDLKRGVYYGLEETGHRIWEFLQTPHTVDEIVRKLSEEYDVKKDRCLEDLLKLLEAMAQQGLISVKNSPS